MYLVFDFPAEWEPKLTALSPTGSPFNPYETRPEYQLRVKASRDWDAKSLRRYRDGLREQLADIDFLLEEIG